MNTHHETLVNLAMEPCSEWRTITETLISKAAPGFHHVPTPERRISASEYEEYIDGLIERLARFREYLSNRHGSGCGDQGHADAVKASNKMAEKIRKALGYTYPKKDISF